MTLSAAPSEGQQVDGSCLGTGKCLGVQILSVGRSWRNGLNSGFPRDLIR